MGPINTQYFSQVNFSRGLAVALLALPAALWAQSTASSPALYTQALSALQKGEVEVAEKLLQDVVQQYPEWAGAWLCNNFEPNWPRT